MNQQGRFDKFTERARLSLSLAQEEARRLRQNYIGTEHLLLGLIDTKDGAAIQVLRKLDVELQQVRAAVEGIIGHGQDTARSIMALTPPAKRAIELAVDESQRLFHGNIGSEHLLLGLIREGDGIAGSVLTNMGITLERARLAVRELEGYSQVTPSTTSSASSTASTARTAPPTPDTAAFGPSDVSQKTPEQMRATIQHLLTAQTPAQIRQIIQTTRQHIDMLE